MFANSQSGADALGVLFTIIMSSRHHKLEPYQYMTDILKKIPHCNSWSDYENWAYSSGNNVQSPNNNGNEDLLNILIFGT